jgi:hypothetical protein
LRESDRALFVQLFVTREFALVQLQGADYSTGLDSIWLLQPQRYCVESTLSAMGWHFSSLPVTSSLISKCRISLQLYPQRRGRPRNSGVYIGFWIGLTVLFFVAARKIEIPILGDIAALMVLLQALGRLLSFLLDGKPSERFIVVFFLELISSVFGLLMRPKISTS